MAKHDDETPRLTAEGLWQFSLARYGAVESLCLALQDDHGLNINLLMLCAYCQSEGCALDELQVGDLIRHNRQWQQEVINPYRALRKTLKPRLSPEDYQQMLAIELALEKEEQQRLFAALPVHLPPDNPEAQANILICLIQSGVPLEQMSATNLERLQALGCPWPPAGNDAAF